MLSEEPIKSQMAIFEMEQRNGIVYSHFVTLIETQKNSNEFWNLNFLHIIS